MEPALNIIVPVYNEGESFAALRSALDSSIREPFRVFVVYDLDDDNTIPAVQKAIAEGETRFHLRKNTVRRGVVGALLTGFSLVVRGPVLVVMGDLSDELSIVDEMMKKYRQGYHLISASRYMSGGKLMGGPFLKRNLSRWAGRTLHWLRGLPTCDVTNAFKLYDAEMLHSLNIESRGGFEINLEVTVKAFLQGYRITELPTTWRDRTESVSKFRLWRWLPHYLKWYVYAFRPGARKSAPVQTLT